MAAPETWGKLRTPLDPLDRQLLLLIDADPGATTGQYAAQLGLSARSVARRFARLQQRGVVHVLARTLPAGRARLAHLLRIHGEPAALRALATALAPQPVTSWVRLSRDGTELICGTVTAAGAPDDRLFGSIATHVGVRSTSIHELLQVWSRSPLPPAPDGVRDALDRAICATLAPDGRMPVRELARRVGVDPSTASRRRRRLLEDGTLHLEADIHPDALHGAGDVMVWMAVRPGTIGRLGARLRALPTVRFTAAITGASNLVAHVIVPEGSTVVSFIDEHVPGDDVTHVEIVTMGTLFKRINPAQPS